MAILKFRIYWEEDDSVYRDVAITHTQTFLQLHQAILKAYEFDSKHPATFFRSNDHWQRGREISLEKYDKPYKVEPLLMADVPVGTEIKNTNQKFIYVYDFTRNWEFMVELIQIEKSANNKLEYPATVRVNGIGPSQYGTKALYEKKIEQQEERYDLEKEEMDEGYGREGDAEETDSDETYTDEGNSADEF